MEFEKNSVTALLHVLHGACLRASATPASAPTHACCCPRALLAAGKAAGVNGEAAVAGTTGQPLSGGSSAPRAVHVSSSHRSLLLFCSVSGAHRPQ